MGSTTLDAEIEQIYADQRYGRAAVLCLYASFWVNKGAQETDRVTKEECFIKSGQYLSSAAAIHRSPEQAVVIGRAHLAFARGETVIGHGLRFRR